MIVSFAGGKKGFNLNFRRVSHLFAKFVSNEHSKGLSTEGKALIEIRKEISHFTLEAELQHNTSVHWSKGNPRSDDKKVM